MLSLGGGELTIEASDVSYITDFVTSLTGGQVKIRLQKLLNRKTLSYDDAVQCAEALAGEYVEFIKTFSKVS